MDQPNEPFSQLFSPKVIADAEASFRRDMATTNTNLRVLPPDPASQMKSSTFASMAALNDSQSLASFLATMPNTRPRYPPLERLLCANVQPRKYTSCEHPGTLTCSMCKLVSYCSMGCQKAHWSIHKIDCKNKMRSSEWQPSYIIERRLPSFISGTSPTKDFLKSAQEEFNSGLSLWGNMPAMDVINLSENEKDTTKDFSLAFVASGDLRHIVRTVNALPSSYSGKLTIMLNDKMPPTVCRNILILLILGTISDKAMAADIALHFWYSTFMPAEYRLQMSVPLTSFLNHMIGDAAISPYPLGSHAKLFSVLPSEAKKIFMQYISQSFSMDDAQDEYDRVRTAPSREDYRERMYSGLRPSHRVAFHNYRRFGIVLPFGAVNVHFNVPNSSLFSLEGKWLQTDHADPLEGWDIGAIIEAGTAHGAREEDIYGCLYFYLSDQLRLFAERIQQFRISFSVFAFHATNLASLVRSNDLVSYNIPASIHFDRIEVSNILDDNYVGLDGVLKSWAPLLTKSGRATILGYFMNWAILKQPESLVLNASKDVISKLIDRMSKEGKLSPLNTIADGTMPPMNGALSFLMRCPDDMQALYENSQSFLKYLKKQKLDNILRSTHLFRKKTHTIVPHRILAPLGGPENALPEFPDADSWYYYTKLNAYTWTERFVEFTRM
ncbi:hypothetical protein Hypma_016436 [Hypsizygus marmoreus]|uniref:MYND-type domain-containing protein n=1 Tax=Hypsizygus marmoreus TaxID=39966 RepID=A0A369J212_HYPMA|nr:hypothetical protein Hypma_016436 [Hypsizygus marmoreus]